MIKESGIWIDQSKAVIVTDTGDELDTKEIQADQDSPKFYGSVIRAIRDVESIFIMGPDDAKFELVKRLEQDESSDRIHACVNAGPMTERQIGEKVRQQFHPQKKTWQR